MDRPRLLTSFIIAGIFATSVAAAFRLTVPAEPPLGHLAPGTPMLESRSGHTATLLSDGRVLIVGGMRRNQDFYKSAELYDPASGKFRQTGNMSVGRVGHAAVLLRSGKVLIVGGWIGHETTDSAELYDPATGTFSQVGKMAARRSAATATLLDSGDVLIVGGQQSDGPGGGLASSEIFHVATLRFQRASSLRHARWSHTATKLQNGQILIAGGNDGGLVAGAELYDPRTGNFAETGNLNTSRYKHTAGLLPDGRVLIAGGSDARDWNGTMASAEIYDPRTGKFSPTNSLNESRFKLPREAVLLNSGRLLVGGGSKEMELYDPSTGKFLVVPGEMDNSWHYMTETKLSNGRVLLAGGYPNNDKATGQTWIYRP